MAKQTAQAIADWAVDQQRTAQLPAKVGRPTILTAELIDQIVALINEGHYVSTACQSLGIYKQRASDWLEQGETELAANPDAASLTAQFADRVKTAEAQAEIQIMREWKGASDKGWLKWATLSSRRFRKHWHDKEPEQRNTFVQNNYGTMPGMASYQVPQLPAAIAADVLSPVVTEVVSEGVRKA